jgi:uncharacterized membrane protein (UPF0127 family)
LSQAHAARGARGRIERITVNAKPFSLTTISSGAPVEVVIEIGGGEAHDLGITVGSLVRWRLLAARSPPSATNETASSSGG